MSERVSNADAALLHRETGTAPQNVGGIIVLAVEGDRFDYGRMVRLLEERISLAPRFRQRVRTVPGRLTNPVWVDDARFDLTYHARRSALPRPGTDVQLLEFAARILSRPLDRSRPLWEMYLVEGLHGGRIAIVTKTHAAMVGEPGGVDLAQVILDAAPASQRTAESLWLPGAEPSAVALLQRAVLGVVRRPSRLRETAQSVGQSVAHSVAHSLVPDLHGPTDRAVSLAGDVTSTVRALVRRTAPSPLHADLGEQRRLAVARTRLDDYRLVRDAFGGSVNDVVLAVVAGALRGWLLSRAESLPLASSVRALVPVSVAIPGDASPAVPAADDLPGRGADDLPGSAADDLPGSAADDLSGLAADDLPGSAAQTVRPLLVDLPVAEPDCVRRLARVRHTMAAHRTSGLAVGAQAITELAGFGPSTLHALGARTAAQLTRRLFSLAITNVPGPQLPLYAAGARMTEMFPISPLSPGRALSIALASYDGGVYFGVNGDWDAVPDVAQIARLLEESLAELVTAAGTGAVAALGHAAGVGRSGTPRPPRSAVPDQDRRGSR